MFKFLAAAVFFAVIVFHCDAQSEMPREKKFNHYIGLQANELLRQLFNLSDNNTVVDNPYLAVYSISMAKTGYGAHFGIGFNYSLKTDKDAPVGRETKVSDVFYRIGIEKRFMLGKRFEASASLDFTSGHQLDKTSTLAVTDLGSIIDSTETTNTTKITSIGGGPRGSLGYHITEKIILATEATMYFSSQKEEQNVLNVDTQTFIFNNNEQTITTSNFNTEIETDRFTFTIPIAIYLIVKF